MTDYFLNSFNLIARLSRNFINFAIADRLEAPVEGTRAGSRHNEKRLSALILDVQKFSQNFVLQSRIEQRWMPVDM